MNANTRSASTDSAGTGAGLATLAISPIVAAQHVTSKIYLTSYSRPCMFCNRHYRFVRLQQMSTTLTKSPTPTGLPAGTFNRILDEGYGPGAWYGSDLRTAVGDVTAAAAFKRPAKARHNIAEIAMHQAYWAGQ